LRIPWTRRSKQLIVKEINPEYSGLEGLMLKENNKNLPDVYKIRLTNERL